MPAKSFAQGQTAYIAPGEGGRDIELKISANSERLQRLEPWPAWDGGDFLDMPVLLKSKGKTTTDHISPAGPWLRYRGHLDKFSDNMFMGATNAFTGNAGHGKNVLSGETGQPFAKIARDYKSRGFRWVVVGDLNYGEGSSREHAASACRRRGGDRPQLRAHSRVEFKKKQGLLALTFQNPDDYERIREDDRISLIGLAGLAPGRPATCIVRTPMALLRRWRSFTH